MHSDHARGSKRRGPLDSTRRVLLAVWRQTSALVALALIGLALYVGYRWGAPNTPHEEVAPTAAEHAHGDHAGGENSAPQFYTCSMHPSVRLTDPNAKCPICFMDLIPATDEDASDPTARRRLRLNEEAAALARIETTPVERFMPRAEVRMYGTLTYDETRIARITARFPGRIERLYLHYLGTPIQAGDHVVDIYSPELLASFEELRLAREAVDAASSTGARPGTGSDLMRQSANDSLVASRERLRLLGLDPELVEQVETQGFDADTFTVTSPISGMVTAVSVVEGEYLQTGSRIATVSDLDRLWLNLEAYESQLTLLRWGQPVTFTVAAQPGVQFEGRIAYIEPEVDPRTRSATVRVAVDNSARRLKPGMYASAVIRPRVTATGAAPGDELAGRWVSPMHPEIVKDGPGQCDICGMDLVPAEQLGVVGDAAAAVAPLVVPRTAVMITGERAVVYVRVPGTDDPTFEGREVVLGPRAGEHYIVVEGLREGELVVTQGAFRIDSEMQIRARPSMMNPEDGGTARSLVWGGHGRFSGADPGAVEGGAGGRSDLPADLLISLTPVYAAYFDVQEALADDDLERALQAARDLVSARELARSTGLVGEAMGVWRRAMGLLPTSDEVNAIADIAEARVVFEDWSKGVIELERTFGHRGARTFHLAHCPMAFDNRGADWLQRGEVIDNPYFGAMMLRCGEIRASFPPAGSAPSEPDDRQGANAGQVPQSMVEEVAA